MTGGPVASRGGLRARRLGSRILRISPTTWLAVAVITYFAVSFALSWLRAVELQTTTWDQGLYQQALWSTAHGRTFYETADVETGGYRSLLEVHTVFVFYLLAPVYAALPYQPTLFAVQSLAVATAAIPLFYLSRDITRSSRLALFTAVAYLVWTPTLSSTLYDFHPEAFLPLELFAIVLLWERERYWAGAGVATVAFVTIELTPVLLFFVAIFFLLPSRETWRRWWAAGSRRTPRSSWIHELRGALASPRVRASAALLGTCVVAYFLLLYLRLDALSAILGVSPLANAPTGYVIGGTPSSLGLSVSNLGVGFNAKVTYWLLLVTLLGLVPLFSPRALVLSLPWFGFTMLSSDLNYVELGFQYGFIAASSLLVAFVYGLPHAARLFDTARRDDGDSTGRGSARDELRRRATAARPGPRALAAAFAILVGVNVALSPANPLMQNDGLGAAYRISYSSAGGYANVEQLAAMIPTGASVIASDDLFPLVANDENAYSFFWTQNAFLATPFDATHPPEYVLVSADRTAAVPAWLCAELYQSSDFGLRGLVWSSMAGPILLFESGYVGSPSAYGNPPSDSFVVAGSTLADARAGYIAPVAGLPAPEVAASDPGALGPFFGGPRASLPGGNYSVTLLLNASAIPGANPPFVSEPTLAVDVSAFAQPDFLNVSLPFGMLSARPWTALTFNLSLPGPTIQFAIQGWILGTNVQVLLDEVEVAPA